MMKKFLKFFIKTLNWLLFLVIVAAVVGMVVLPYFFKIKPYVVLSGSMEPTVPTGSMLWINTNDRYVEVGDIAAYELPDGGAYVTHRIVGTKEGNYVFKGDANDTEDLNTVDEEQILGEYVFHIPKLGMVLNRIQNNPYLLIPIGAGVISIMLLENLVS